MGVLLDEAANGGGIVPGAEIVSAGFGVQVFAAVAEDVSIRWIGVLFVVEGIAASLLACTVGV